MIVARPIYVILHAPCAAKRPHHDLKPREEGRDVADHPARTSIARFSMRTRYPGFVHEMCAYHFRDVPGRFRDVPGGEFS